MGRHEEGTLVQKLGWGIFHTRRTSSVTASKGKMGHAMGSGSGWRELLGRMSTSEGGIAISVRLLERAMACSLIELPRPRIAVGELVLVSWGDEVDLPDGKTCSTPREPYLRLSNGRCLTADERAGRAAAAKLCAGRPLSLPSRSTHRLNPFQNTVM